MLPIGFMSEVKKYQRIAIGGTEGYFIRIFAIQPSTAWKIYAHMKKVKPMAYKNVHNRIKRLQDLGLIEVQEVMPRRAIKYRLTSRGLFERLMLHSTIFPLSLEFFKNNIILETILYQYFEPKTISKFESKASEFLTYYLNDCCESILGSLEFYNDDAKEFDHKEESMAELLEENISTQVENFVSKIVKLSASFVSDGNGGLKPIDWFPIDQLAKDKKFLNRVERIKDHFDRGYKKFVK
jgi:hypothetical protein